MYPVRHNINIRGCYAITPKDLEGLYKPPERRGGGFNLRKIVLNHERDLSTKIYHIFHLFIIIVP